MRHSEETVEEMSIGIDFGTSFFRVAAFVDGKMELLTDKSGEFSIPNFLSFAQSQLYVGCGAKNQILRNPQNTVYHYK